MLSSETLAAPEVRLDVDRTFFELREPTPSLLKVFMASMALLGSVLGFILLGIAVILSFSRPGLDMWGVFLGAIFLMLTGYFALRVLVASRRTIARLTNDGVSFPSVYAGTLPWLAVRSWEYDEYGLKGKNRWLKVKLYPEFADDMHWKGLIYWTLFLVRNKTAETFTIPLNVESELASQFVDLFRAHVDLAKASRSEDSSLAQIDAHDAKLAARVRAQEIEIESVATFPYITVVLTGILLIIYIWEISAGNALGGVLPSPELQTLVQFGGVFGEEIQKGQWWRVFSAPLLHANFQHLLFNAIALWVGGLHFERYIGPGWFAVIFAISAISGSLMSLILNPSYVVSVGASGGVVGLFAAAAVVSLRFPPGRMRTDMLATAFETLIPALIPVLQSSSGPRIDYAGHFGGAIGGAMLGTLLLALWRQTQVRPRYGKAAGFVAVLMGSIGLAAVAINGSKLYSVNPNSSAVHQQTEQRASQERLHGYRSPVTRQ